MHHNSWGQGKDDFIEMEVRAGAPSQALQRDQLVVLIAILSGSSQHGSFKSDISSLQRQHLQ